MHVDQPPLVGSDPEPSIAVPEQLIRINFAVGQRRIGVQGAANRVGFEFVTNDLPESSTSDPNDQPTVAGLSQVGKPHSGHRIALRRTGLPVPKAGFCASPESAGTVLTQTPDECRRSHLAP